MKKAVRYLRSSKDRSDVAIDAQRTLLAKVEQEKNLLIVGEYTDIVESAKSECRPDFQRLLVDLRRPGRQWEVIIMDDHSRLSRQPYVGHVFRYECSKVGVEVVFASFPELDPISRIIMDNVMDAMAVVHSVMSRQKGLGGMAENIEAGWRAGGRAPYGYRLEKISTGAIRDGEPVTKSVLTPTAESAVIARYLKARAAGTPRRQALREHSVPLRPNTLIGIEWNALTYAGHTVWNRHNATKSDGGYVGAQKLRPRAEWHIKRDTHPALIAEHEAEAILHRLGTSVAGAAVSNAKRGVSAYLLTSVLHTHDGRRWDGWKEHYRVKSGAGKAGRYVKRAPIDEAVIAQMVQDFSSPKFIDALVDESRRAARPSHHDSQAKDLQAEIVTLNAKIAKAVDLAIELDDAAPALRKVNELEARRSRLAEEMTRLEQEKTTHQALRSVTPDQVRDLVGNLKESLMQADQSRIKAIIDSTVDRVTLNPVTLDCKIRYRIPVDSTLTMASPRGFEPLLPP